MKDTTSIELESDEVDADDVREALHATWREKLENSDFRKQVADICGEELDEPPLTVTQAGEGYDVVTLIVIAATGRVVGGAAERLIALVASQVIPKVRDRLPGVVRLKKDED